MSRISPLSAAKWITRSSGPELMSKIVRSKAVSGVRQDIKAAQNNAHGANSSRATGSATPVKNRPKKEHAGGSLPTVPSSGHWATALHALVSAIDRQHNDATALMDTMNVALSKLDVLAKRQDELLSAWKITVRRQAAIAEEQAEFKEERAKLRADRASFQQERARFQEEQAMFQLRSTEAIARVETLAIPLLAATGGGTNPASAGPRKNANTEISIQRTQQAQKPPPKKIKPDHDQQSSSARPSRHRRTKAEMLIHRAELAKIEELGLKRGRGRPKKGAPTATQIAQIVAEASKR